jgi:hypothetical protein
MAGQMFIGISTASTPSLLSDAPQSPDPSDGAITTDIQEY